MFDSDCCFCPFSVLVFSLNRCILGMKRLSDVKEWVGGMDICGMPGIGNGGQEVGGSGREGVVGRPAIYLTYFVH